MEEAIMGNPAREVLEKFEEKNLLSYEEIRKLYEDEGVQGVNFFSDGTDCYITNVRLINGENLSFR